jgi:hypothetical protein
MTDKEFVIKSFPDAYFEKEIGISLYWIWVRNPGRVSEEIIGSGLTEDEAWEDAKNWIDNER